MRSDRKLNAPGICLHCLLTPLIFIVTAGCANLGTKSSRVGITSDPAGADVYVMGNPVGVTPITLDEHAVFPPAYPVEKQALYGAVELRKAGCNSAMQRVSVRALTHGLHVKLDCAEARVVKDKPGIEWRLSRVQELRDKGLITEQEARESRRRILDEL